MNLQQMLENTVRKNPAKTAIVSGERRISYADVDEASNRIANSLIQMGVNKGDRVAMLLPNSAEFVFIYIGIIKAGSVPVPLDTRLKTGEIASFFANCEPVVLISDTPFLEPLLPVLSQFKTIKHVINLSPDYTNRCINYRQMMATGSAEKVNIEVKPDYLGLISYPSGPSTHPKGSAISNNNLCALAVASAEGFKQTAEDVVMLFALPLYHNFALGSVLLTSIYLGSTIVIVPGTGISINSLMEAIEKERGTMWLGVPYIFALAIKIAEEEGIKHDLSSLRLCASGGAPLPIDTILRFKEHYGLTIADVWGLTEGVAHVTCQPIDGSGTPGASGKALPGYTLKIVDDNGNELPPHQDGEVIISGPMMDCYYNNPEDTSKAIKDGWLHTGDIGNLDEDGYLFLTGRKKNMIILKGQNIYPIDIEELLLTHPSIAEAKVVGIPDRLRGEVVRATIKLRDKTEATEQEIRHFCLERIADYKAPREIVFTEDSIT